MLQKINHFEQPIFVTKQEEVSRILASKVHFKINLSVTEFWKHFLDYTFKQVINKNLDYQTLYQGQVININEENSKIRTYVIKQYETNKMIEFATFKNNILNKIYLEVIPTKYNQEIKVIYLESRRDDQKHDKKEHKKLLNNFNAKTLNKVIILKDYLLGKVR